MSLYKRVLEELRSRRERVIEGKVNCIPSPLTRFRRDFVGIERGKYYLISGNTKSGKTQLASEVFIYNTILFCFNNPEKARLKIFYYALEETPEVIMEKFMCHLLFKLSNGKTRISPTDLKSTSENKPIDPAMLEILESQEYAEYISFFEKSIYFSEVTNPTGINKEVRSYVESAGTTIYKKITIKDPITGELKEVNKRDHYVPNDPDEYVLVFIDHISLISPEQGLDLRGAINKLSSEYLVKLRNNYGVTPVVVQQQAADTESTDNFKLNKLRPSPQGLADSKYTARDCNVMLSIFSPYRHELKDFLKYDITKFQNNFRSLEVNINRSGDSNGIIGLFFDGAVNSFYELPRPEEEQKLKEIYKYIEQIRENY